MKIKPKTIRAISSTLILSLIGIVSGIFLNRFGEHSENYLQTEETLISHYSQKKDTETPVEEKPEAPQESPTPSYDTDNSKTQNETDKSNKQTVQKSSKSEKTDSNNSQSNISSTSTDQTNANESEEETDQQQPSSQNDYTQEVVRLCNNHRQEAGISPLLNQNSKLQQAANIRCEEIKQSFSHTRPNDTSAYTVLGEVGVSYTTWGENIAYGQRTPQEVVNGWMNSPGHRANILNANFKEIAVGMKDYYWVQIFI